MRASLYKFCRKLLKRMSESVEINGLGVGATDCENLSKVEGALRLIKEVDPRRYGRLIKDLEGVWATLTPGSIGQFDYSDWTCELDPKFVADASVERVASTIVHEATHARLWRRGVRYEEKIRHRVEAICLRQEQVFAKRLPPQEALAQELETYLDLPAEFWTDTSMDRARLRGFIAALKHLDMPRGCIGRAVKFLRKRLRRRRKAAVAKKP